MEFTVPQFIEKEAKIVGPFTFKQFVFVGLAGGICLFLYFTVSLTTFIILAVILLGSAFALAFLKIEKTPLPIYIKNLFTYFFQPKVYLWRKKITPITVLREKGEGPEIKEARELGEEANLKIASKSRLQDLATLLKARKK